MRDRSQPCLPIRATLGFERPLEEPSYFLEPVDALEAALLATREVRR
jgi:hypothetical protein